MPVLLIFQILIPLILIGRVATARRRSRHSLEADIVLAAVYLLAVSLALPAIAVPWYLPGVFGLFLAAASVRPLLRPREAETSRSRVPQGLWTTLRALAILGLAAVSGIAVLGHRSIPGQAVELAFPLDDGVYLVANGGSNPMVNLHLQTLNAERARPYRGQSYAIDIVKVGEWGSRRSGPFASAAEDYAIFGDTIRAPCAGTVVRSSDGQPDSRPPGQAPETLEGNHVILECRDVWILLAHMQRGSVRGVTGDSVGVGQPLGVVGNSGNSSEPHLHIHAQRPGRADAPLGGDPLPLTFGGRQLVRNDRVDTR